MAKQVAWEGVFPAVTTQFRSDFRSTIDATATVIDALIRDGVSGLIVCGTVGENSSLSRDEKIKMMETAKRWRAAACPCWCGVAEYTTALASSIAKEAARVGLDGVMLMPALVYSSKPHETAGPFPQRRQGHRSADHGLQQSADLQNDVTPEMLASLADARPSSASRSRPATPGDSSISRNMVGDRFILFAGLDDVVVESIMIGAVGWVSGLSNAFPREGETLFRLARAGRLAEAMPLYRLVHAACCISMRAPTSSSASSCASTSWAAART